MKHRLKVIVLGLAIAAVTQVGFAKSELASISIKPLWPTNSQPGNLVLYEVTVERTGQGMLEVDFNCTCLPDGVCAAFAPVRFTGNDPKTKTVIMAITGSQPPPTDLCAFTVTGKARNQSLTMTNTVGASAVAVPSAPTLLSPAIQPNGDAELRGTGLGGETYQIETSQDLKTWTTAGACTADGNGRFAFVHSGAKAKTAPMGFYRVVKSAP